ncbi:zinc/manganese transport system ATP-binding protein [Nakamurella flavida]|uniref:metal ABC transporter ATP-binding protein n=1 Tax=Nakamurella flavida TaxID=363630 RepID=UPI002781082B|nr:ATP-binding cassette domain-containing protein [Nakamurella flavida]MDP9778515.1 zinc/manganese transport system ATP-binding protein [Nakamurella flavida]
MTDSVRVIGVSALHGRVLAVDRVDAVFRAGAVTAVTGGNGSGKSALVAVVAGVHPAAQGEVVRPPGGVALVPQSWSADRPLPLSVRAAVAMGRWHRRGRWGRLCTADHAIVADAMERLGVTDLAGRQIGALSGGQRQRVLVAQGLAQRAPVLLLDEPTAGVDAPARAWIEDALAAEADRGTVVVHITHDPASVERAGYRLHLEAGRVAAPVPPTAGAGIGVRS